MAQRLFASNSALYSAYPSIDPAVHDLLNKCWTGDKRPQSSAEVDSIQSVLDSYALTGLIGEFLGTVSSVHIETAKVWTFRCDLFQLIVRGLLSVTLYLTVIVSIGSLWVKGSPPFYQFLVIVGAAIILNEVGKAFFRTHYRDRIFWSEDTFVNPILNRKRFRNTILTAEHAVVDLDSRFRHLSHLSHITRKPENANFVQLSPGDRIGFFRGMPVLPYEKGNWLNKLRAEMARERDLVTRERERSIQLQVQESINSILHRAHDARLAHWGALFARPLGVCESWMFGTLDGGVDYRNYRERRFVRVISIKGSYRQLAKVYLGNVHLKVGRGPVAVVYGHHFRGGLQTDPNQPLLVINVVTGEYDFFEYYYDPWDRPIFTDDDFPIFYGGLEASMECLVEAVQQDFKKEFGTGERSLEDRFG